MMSRYIFVALLMVSAACSGPRTASQALNEARSAMGNPASLQFAGTGTNGFFGQALLAGEEWPRRPIETYTRRVNYEQRSSAEEINYAQPVFGGQRQNTQVNGDKAWNVGANGPAPQLAAAEERQLQIWMTPHGFIAGALAAADPTLSTSEGGDVISFKALGKYTVTGTLDTAHRVTKVETTLANSVLGDIPLVATYSDYQDFSGVQFPKRMVVTQGGLMVWDLTISEVQQVPFDLPVPPAVASATIPAVRVASSEVAPGVWFVGGGSHHSLVVEFADHLAVVEAPQTEARSLAVIAEAKRLAPNKPIKYLITSHHHFDHTGGFRTYVAEGATIVTHQSNVAYFEKAAAAPATLVPDAQARAPKPAQVAGVGDKHVLTDGTQTIEVYATGGDSHTKEFTLVYLPGPKVLVEADAYSTPATADAPPPNPVPPDAATLYDEIRRLKLEVKTIAPIHGRGPGSFDEFRRYVGKI